jgi:hypothetical protein
MKINFFLVSLVLTILLTSSCTKDKVGGGVPYPEVICSDTVSFSNEILPIIENNCTGCHDNQNGYSLTNHQNISSNYASIVGSMKGQGYQLMPQG